MITASSYTIAHAGDLERSGAWRLARRTLGVSSFGINVVELAPGQSTPEHDELERDQEEVFLTLRGAPAIVIDGERHEAPVGTWVRIDAPPRRRLVNAGSEPAAVLIVSAPRTSGYEPMEWA